MGVGNSLNINQAGFQSFDGVSVFSGRTLQSGTGISITNPNGVGGDPTISSTLSFPLDPSLGGTGANNVATSGTLLRGNGTDFVPTTATYPNTAGTSGNLLTSDGTNWVSSTPTPSGTTCLFSAYRSSTASNVTGDATVYTIPFDTALVNLGSAYNTGTGVFTAPTNGNYMFSCTVNLQDLIIGHTEGIFSFNGSTYESRFARYNMGAMATSGVFSASGSLIIPMTAGQTMSVFAFVSGATKTVDVVGAAAPAIYTNFSGYLIL